MRPRQSVAGGVAAVGIGAWVGWIGRESAASPAATLPTPTAVLPEAAGVRLSGTFDPARIYRERSSGVVTIDAVFASGSGAASQGSGLVVSSDGTILTSAHVVTDAGSGSGNGGAARPAARVYVEFDDRDRLAATIVGWDVFSDVGALKVDPRRHALLPVPLGDSAAVRVGDPVAAIGARSGTRARCRWAWFRRRVAPLRR